MEYTAFTRLSSWHSVYETFVKERSNTCRTVSSEWLGGDIEGMGWLWKKYMGPACIIEALLGDAGE